MNIYDLNKIHWDRLKTFYTVAQCGNYKDASSLLNMSIPNISRHIALLEEDLGVELINRKKGPKGEGLSEYGKVFLEITSQIYKLLGEGVDTIHNAEKISGIITIATTRGFAQSWLFPKLLDFQQQYPDIIIDIAVTNYFHSLMDFDADLYVAPKFLESHELIHEFLGDFSCGVYASKEYLDRYGIPKTLDDLDNHKIIDWKFHSAVPYAHWLLTAGLKQGIEREPVLIVDDIYLGIAAVEQGYGISAFFDYIEQSNPKLIRILKEYNIGAVKMFLISNKKSKNLKRLDLIVQYLKKYSNPSL